MYVGTHILEISCQNHYVTALCITFFLHQDTLGFITWLIALTNTKHAFCNMDNSQNCEEFKGKCIPFISFWIRAILRKWEWDWFRWLTCGEIVVLIEIIAISPELWTSLQLYSNATVLLVYSTYSLRDAEDCHWFYIITKP